MPAGRPSGPSTVNKSKLIRDFYEQNPDASVKEAMDSLSKSGIEVSAPLVSGVRRNLGMPAGKRKGKNKEVTGEEIVNLKQKISELDLTAESLDEILASIEDMGSISRVREIISTLNQIDSSVAVEDEEDAEESIENSAGDEDEEEDEDEDEEEYDDED